MKGMISLQIETAKNYRGKVEAIKKKLATFTDESFFYNMYHHFQVIRNPRVGIVSNFPWCCFLALKWKFTRPVRSKKYEMKEKDYIDIINRIYNLQNEMEGLYDNSKFLLSIRRMIVNQQLYQVPMKLEINTIARQYYWYSNYDGGILNVVLMSCMGLLLSSIISLAPIFHWFRVLMIKKNRLVYQ